MKNIKTLVIASGGLDSTTLIYKALNEYNEVEALTFNYGSLHNNKEHSFLEKVCKTVHVKLTTIHLPLNTFLKSALFENKDAIPEGHYEDITMQSTVVPFRNGIMLAMAAGYAESNNFKYILLGNHSGDHAIYPDCRSNFIDAIHQAIYTGTYTHVEVVSPFCNMTKSQIVAEGAKLGVPFELTWSCYKGGDKHCGKCGTCVERKEAFKLANIKDPTEYEE